MLTRIQPKWSKELAIIIKTTRLGKVVLLDYYIKYLEIPSGSEGRVSLLFSSIYDHGFLFLHQVYSTLRVNVTKPCGTTLCSLNSLFYIFPAHKKKTTLFNAPKQNVTISAVLHVNLIVQTFTSTPGLIFIQNSYLSVTKKLTR